jgi:hypothetical protein
LFILDALMPVESVELEVAGSGIGAEVEGGESWVWLLRREY